MSECVVSEVDIKKLCEVVIKCSLARPSSSLVLETPKVCTGFINKIIFILLLFLGPLSLPKMLV